MDNFSAVRTLAAQKREALKAKAHDAPSLLASAMTDTGYSITPIDPASPNLGGGDGALSRNTKTIYVSNALAPGDAVVRRGPRIRAHLDRDARRSGHRRKGAIRVAPEEATPLGVRRVEAYSPQESREQLANVFAREFLLPRSHARKLFVDEAWNASKIAYELKLPPGLVHQQLATSLLLPEMRSEDMGEPTKAAPPLDPSQKEAAEHEGSPLLVEAGPRHRKDQDVDRAHRVSCWRKASRQRSILALTFSNKAAAEIRERIAATRSRGRARNSGRGPSIRLGSNCSASTATWWTSRSRSGFSTRPTSWLPEEDLLRLGLGPLLATFRAAGGPSPCPFRDFAGEGRTQDARRIPAGRRRLEAERRRRRRSPEGRKGARSRERLRPLRPAHARREAGRFWRPHRPLVELFGCIPTSWPKRSPNTAICLSTNTRTSTARAPSWSSFSPASANLWIVGDAKQSIYASAARRRSICAISRRDYPGGVRKPLKVNYRSYRQIVRRLRRVREVDGCRPIRDRSVAKTRRLVPTRSTSTSPTDLDAEIEGIAGQIGGFRADGIPYADRRCLCRHNSALEKFPFGWRRWAFRYSTLATCSSAPESATCWRSCRSSASTAGAACTASRRWRRTGCLSPTSESSWRRRRRRRSSRSTCCGDWTTSSALRRRSDRPDRLAADTQAVAFMTGPGAFLVPTAVRPRAGARLSGRRFAGRPAKAARHPSVSPVRDRERPGQAGRRSEAPAAGLGAQARSLRRRAQPPGAAIGDISALTPSGLMTVHASKGLEFRAVHVPAFASGKFPLQWTGQRCAAASAASIRRTPPTTIKEEEECLFFVAMSRAKDSFRSHAPKIHREAAEQTVRILRPNQPRIFPARRAERRLGPAPSH